MRFEISKVLDAIEDRVCTDPALARAVLDLAEVVRFADLDGGRPASMLRLGIVIDALGRLLEEDGVVVYPVVHRALLSDADLTSNERMVVRRWADDGLVEVLTNPADRALELADLLGLPMITRGRFDGMRDRFGWLASQPGRLLAPVLSAGGPALVPRGGGPLPPAEPSANGLRLLARVWHCPESGCTHYGGGGGGGAFADLARVERRDSGQPPPTLRTGAPACPRHDARLTDAGPRPRTEVLSVRVGGQIRRRFVVAADQAVVVGRAPERGDGIMLGQWLTDEARRWISRSHVRFELRGRDLVAQDVSTNGSGVRPQGSMEESERLPLADQKSRVIKPGDIVELYPGVQVGWAGTWSSGGVPNPTSVMAEAPTMAMRLVDRP
ncbi:FHA domain-containing protein [Solwaraspora sp. WMMD1047]|uniref:FHA domain-containing protein n=1 Tax=Solwaraspora sp. WMMD1047 TaxID=3016102 RepID=UPI0024176BA9|nr:FHA domain-containing protein [Solwaraspora sp. WMMD1047]MDG4833111.1 FHA domain-containing protein [Solwaraspora sp. WMMD1047]